MLYIWSLLGYLAFCGARCDGVDLNAGIHENKSELIHQGGQIDRQQIEINELKNDLYRLEQRCNR